MTVATLLDQPQPAATVTWRPPVTGTRATAGFLARRWPILMAIVAMGIYVWAGAYLLYTINYEIGDAVTRSGVARAIIFGRDPHLAALGAAWMPLPTLAQLPTMAVLHPLGLAPLAGPVMSGLFSAATIPVLATIGRRLGLATWLRVTLTAAYAFNPVIIFWSASGMSETPSIFFLCAASAAWLRWVDTREVIALGATGLALAFALLTRYENIPVVFVFAVAAAVLSPRGRRLASAVVVTLPAAFAMFMWMASLHVLRGNALIFYELLKVVGTPPRDSNFLPAQRNVFTSVEYILPRTLYMAPVVLVVVPLLFIEEMRAVLGKRLPRLAGSTIVVVAALFPASIAFLLLPNKTFGNPRYFLPVVPLALVASMYALRRGSPFATRGWRALVVVFVVAGTVTSTALELDRRYTGVEAESSALRGLATGELAEEQGFGGAATYLSDWRSVAQFFNARDLDSSDLIGLETTSSTVAFTLYLFVDRPELFAISEDRDYEQLIQLANPPFTYIVNPVSRQNQKPRILEVVNNPPDGMQWRKVFAREGTAEVYHLEPANTAAPTP